MSYRTNIEQINFIADDSYTVVDSDTIIHNLNWTASHDIVLPSHPSVDNRQLLIIIKNTYSASLSGASVKDFNGDNVTSLNPKSYYRIISSAADWWIIEQGSI